MEPRVRLAGVLRELRELGVEDWYFEELTAEAAAALLKGSAGAAVAPVHAAPAAAPATTETPAATTQGSSALSVLATEASTCTRCKLAGERTQVVFGRGNPEADVVVVGEAPGGEEDRRGEPFVGPAGKMLDLLLAATGFPRGSVYICNVLKCRPPGNRDPQPDEVAACSDWLHRQLETVRPKVLLAVGKFAGQMLAGSDASISRLRGVVHSYRDIPVVATYHPAYLLRTPQAVRGTWQDFQLVRRVLDEHD